MQLLISACMVLLFVGSLVWSSVLNHSQGVYALVETLETETQSDFQIASNQKHGAVSEHGTQSSTALLDDLECVLTPILTPLSDDGVYDLVLQTSQELGGHAEFSGTLQLSPDHVAILQRSNLAIQSVSVQSDMNAGRGRVSVLSELEFRVDQAGIDLGLSIGQLLSIGIDPGNIGFGSYTLSSDNGILRLSMGYTKSVKIAPHTLVVRASMDVNADGVIDELDHDLFMAAAVVGADIADLNHDGLIDDFDTALMIEAVGHDVLELVLGDSEVYNTDLGSETIQDENPTGVTADSDARMAESGRFAESSDGAPLPTPGGLDGVQVPNQPIEEVQLDEPEILPPRIVSILPNPSEWVVDQNGITEIVVRFSKPVILPSSGGFYLWSATGSELILVAYEFTQSTKVLRLTPFEPLRNDRYTLVIDYSVQGTTGLALDGEVATPQNPNFPTGDGEQGGQAVFGFTVHQGDVNRDGVIDSLDGDILIAQSGMTSGDAGFDPRADLNADGRVDFLDVAIFEFNAGSELVVQDGHPLRVTARSPDPNSPYVANALSTVTVNFDLPAKACSIRPSSLYATLPGGMIQPAECVTTTNAQTAILFGFNPPLPSDSVYQLHLSNAFADLSGEFVESDGQLAWSVAVTPPPPTRDTDSALIMGRVVDAMTGSPLRGAFVTHHYFEGYQEGNPPLPGIAFTDIDGKFVLETVEFEGVEQFLIDIDGPPFTGAGYAENLRVVEVMAGRCEQVREATLNALNPQKMFMADQGGVLEDEMNGDMVQLTIPPGALREDSEISMTILSTPDAIRDRLPTLVSGAGMFIDIAGVFGDETDMPVTLRVPNLYNLPLGTRVRFGKISHVTAEWTDLQTPFGAPMPDDPDEGVGIVVADSQGGTVIEVDFTNFCTICTGYCLPYPDPEPMEEGRDPEEGGEPDCPEAPGNVCGSSVINTHQGFLWETIGLPVFSELGGSWGVQLGYASRSAAPSVTLSGSVNYNSTRPVERTAFQFQVEGVTASAFYDYSSNNQQPMGTFIWNGRNGFGELVPTGSYEYSIEAISLNSDVPIAVSDEFGGAASQVFSGTTYPGLVELRSETINGRAIIVNESESVFGSGWRVKNLSELHFDPDGCIVLVYGSGDWKLFAPTQDDDDLFVSPSGEFSQLKRLVDGNYRRSFTDGSYEEYSALGKLSRRVDRYGYIEGFTYDGAGRLKSMVSPVGSLVEFLYDSNGHIDRIIDSAGRVTQLEVNANGHLVSITDPEGGIRQFTYDAEGRLTAQIGARGERSDYIYEQDRVVRNDFYDIGGGGLIRVREYGPSVLQGEISGAIASGLGDIDNPIPLVTDPTDTYIDGRGALTQYKVNAEGLVKSVVDGLGREIKYEYSDDNLVTRMTRPNNTAVTYSYNDDGDITRITELYNNSSVNVEYEGPFGLPTRIWDQLNNPTVLSFYPNGNLETVTDAESFVTRYFYEDARFPNLPTRVVDAVNAEVRIQYNDRGNPQVVTDPLGRQSHFSYDATGNVSAVTDPKGYTTRLVYDQLNRPVSMTDPEDRLTQLGYEDNGCGCSTSNLTSVILPNGSSILFEYDGLNRQVARTDQGGRVSTVEYDAEAAPTLATRRTGEQIRYTHDILGRMTSLTNELTGELISSYRYDILGNIEQATNADADVEMEYDPIGRLLEETQTVYLPAIEPLFPEDDPIIRAPIRSRLSYSYDIVNRLTSRADEAGEEIFRYNARGLVREMEFRDPEGSSLIWTPSYDGVGRRTQVIYPNGLTQELDFDIAGQLSSIDLVETVSGISIDRFDYDRYSANSQLESVVRTRQAADPIAWEYDYSPAGRLVSAIINDLPDGVGTTEQNVTFGQDGRMESVDGFEVEFDPSGRMTSIEHDAGIERRFDWDITNRLTGVRERAGNIDLSVTKYGYDAFGRRVFKDVNGVVGVTFHSINNRVSDISQNGRVSRSVYLSNAIDDYVAIYSGQQDAAMLHKNRLGSVVGASGLAGQWIDATNYSPFGGRVNNEGRVAMAVPRGLAGLLLDYETGLVAVRDRYYSSQLGIFVSEDSLGLPPLESTMFAYSDSDPVNYKDIGGFRRELTDEERLAIFAAILLQAAAEARPREVRTPPRSSQPTDVCNPLSPDLFDDFLKAMQFHNQSNLDRARFQEHMRSIGRAVYPSGGGRPGMLPGRVLPPNPNGIPGLPN